jgi:DNA-binding MarR family transcriptional regulator
MIHSTRPSKPGSERRILGLVIKSADATRSTDPCQGAAAPDACRAELGWGLLTAARAFAQWAAEAVADLPGGLRGHLVLASIAQGQAPSQAVLAGQIGLDRTVMTYLVDELEQAGFLERKPDPSDRRARLLTITEAGTAALSQYRTRIDAAETRLLGELDADERRSFRRSVERVARASQASTTPSAPGAC